MQSQFVDRGAVHVITCADRQFDETCAREQHGAGDGVVGEPGLVGQREAARQHHAAGVGQVHDGAQQRMAGVAEPQRI